MSKKILLPLKKCARAHVRVYMCMFDLILLMLIVVWDTDKMLLKAYLTLKLHIIHVLMLVVD